MSGASRRRLKEEAQKDHEVEAKKELDEKAKARAEAAEKARDTGDPEFNRFLMLVGEKLPRELAKDTVDEKERTAWYKKNKSEIQDILSKNEGYINKPDKDNVATTDESLNFENDVYTG